MLIFDGKTLHSCDTLYRYGRTIANKHGIIQTYKDETTAKFVQYVILRNIEKGKHLMSLPHNTHYATLQAVIEDADCDTVRDFYATLG